ncbi:MAG: ubiquinone biosynthesis protein COQ7 [Clostridiales bacterium]|jgi:rubrerythrin|nr:ubiquinone biosynthesis protein COQ7 [Clostridiales bacterium]
MPAFAPAFPGAEKGKLSAQDLLQVIRLDIAGELEAIYLYEAHARASDDKFASKVFLDIANEEKVHVGELLTLMNYLDPANADKLSEGNTEVNNLLGSKT